MRTIFVIAQNWKRCIVLAGLSTAALFALITFLSLPSSAATPAQETPKSGAKTETAAKEPSAADQVVAVLRAEIVTDSLNPRLHYQLANTLHEVGNKEEALVEYDKALSLRPDFMEALVNKGALLNELGNIQEAISSFQQALKLDPRSTRALVNLGNSFYALKLYDDAMKEYRLAVETDTTFAEGYYYIGIAFADAGIYREAVREWEKILAVAPTSEAAKNARENIDLLKSYLAGTESGAPPLER